MIRPEELKNNEPLMWSAGTGTDVWEMFCACIAGDLDTVKAAADQRSVTRAVPLRVSHADLLRGA